MWVDAGAALAAGTALWFGLAQARKYRLVRDLPSSKPGGVFIGLVEVTARMVCAQPLISHLAERPCAWYRWTVEERWSRLVTETTRDKDGRTHTTTRTESGWKTVASGGEERCFDLVDDSGRVQVDPAGARVDGVTAFDRECRRGFDALYYGKGPEGGISDSDGVRRFQERILPLEVPGYVIGQARERRDVVGAEIARDAQAPLFVISVAGEKSVERGFFWWGVGLEILGLALAVGAPWWAHATVDPERGWGAALVGGGSFALAWMLGEAWLIQYGLIELRNRVRQGWANIDVQLKRRYDLITRLLPVVQAYCQHEAGTQAALAGMRSQLLATPPGVPGPDPAAMGRRVLAVAEAYPQLQAQAQFQELHRALVDCEDRIALARNYFNDIAANWNTRRERVPDCFIAGLLGMKAQVLMHALDANTNS
jgi:hypothetical protein